MKIVFLVSRFPWPIEKGDKLRAFHFIKELSGRHEIHLVALTDRRVSAEDLEMVQPFCTAIDLVPLSFRRRILGLVRAFFLGLPFQTGYFFHSGVQKVLMRILDAEQPGVLFCQLVRVAGYVQGWNGVKILDFQDALSMNMERRAAKSPPLTAWFFAWEARLLRRYERKMPGIFDRCMIISEPDRAAMDHPQADTMMVVPNGVDFDFFNPDPQAVPRFDVVFTGNMGYAPNIAGAVWLANEIMPVVRKTFPNARLLIAGASPAYAVRRLGSPLVEVSGWMDDIRDAYRSASVFVAPMLTGSGLQNKLLEAMSMKLPCVTTSLANAALNGAHGDEILVADTTEQMAGSIVQLLSDKDMAQRIAESGHRLVHQRYSWKTIISDMETKLDWRSCEGP